MSKYDYDKRRDIYKVAIAEYGKEAQLWMVIEEMSELAKEICKYMRGKRNLDDMADEIADVTIMLEQARLIFGVNDLVCEHMDEKIARLMERLDRPRPYDCDEVVWNG